MSIVSPKPPEPDGEDGRQRLKALLAVRRRRSRWLFGLSIATIAFGVAGLISAAVMAYTTDRGQSSLIVGGSALLAASLGLILLFAAQSSLDQEKADLDELRSGEPNEWERAASEDTVLHA